MAFAVRAFDFEIVGATEVVFGAGAADGWEFGVAVHEEFYFAFAPPAGVMNATREIGADILTRAFDTIEDRVKAFGFHRILTTELGVEVGGIGRHISERVI